MDTAVNAGRALAQQLTIVNRKGLHARASARFVRTAECFDAEIKVTRDGTTVAGNSSRSIGEPRSSTRGRPRS